MDRALILLMCCAGLITSCTTTRVDMYRLRSDLEAFHRSPDADTLRFQPLSPDSVRQLYKGTSIIVAARDSSTGIIRIHQAEYRRVIPPLDDTSLAFTDRSIRIVLSEGYVDIPLRRVLGLYVPEAQAGYVDTVPTGRKHRINEEHLERDMAALYRRDTIVWAPITPLRLNDLDDLNSRGSLLIAYHDLANDSVRVVSAWVHKITSTAVDSATLESRIERITSRTPTRVPIGLYDGMTTEQLRASTALTGTLAITAFVPNSTPMQIPLWKVESIVAAEEQIAYDEYDDTPSKDNSALIGSMVVLTLLTVALIVLWLNSLGG